MCVRAMPNQSMNKVMRCALLAGCLLLSALKEIEIMFHVFNNKIDNAWLPATFQLAAAILDHNCVAPTAFFGCFFGIHDKKQHIFLLIMTYELFISFIGNSNVNCIVRALMRLFSMLMITFSLVKCFTRVKN